MLRKGENCESPSPKSNTPRLGSCRFQGTYTSTVLSPAALYCRSRVLQYWGCTLQQYSTVQYSTVQYSTVQYWGCTLQQRVRGYWGTLWCGDLK